MRFLSVFLCLACLPGSAWAAVPQLKYTAQALQKSWDEVYVKGDEPILESLLEDVLVPELLVLNAQDLPLANDRQGFRALTAQSGTAVAFFPVKSLSAVQAERLYGQLYRIEGLAQKYQLYLGTIDDRNAPADFPQTLAQRQHALELERFTAHMLLFLMAEKMPQKCIYYSRAKAQADAVALYASSDLPSGFAGYGGLASRFIQDKSRGFGRIPSQLCQFQTQLGRAENEATVRAKVQDTLLKSIDTSIEKHGKVIEQRKNALQSVVSKSELAIPMDKLSALNRGFQDTNSLLMMIKGDLLLLYTDSPSSQSLIKLIEAKIKNLSQGTDLVAVAQRALDDYEKALKPFLVSLEGIPNLPYLNTQQKERVRVCSNLSQILSSQQDPGQAAQNQKNFNACLTATAELYRQARENFADDPALIEFSSKLGMIMSYFPEIPKPTTPRT